MKALIKIFLRLLLCFPLFANAFSIKKVSIHLENQQYIINSKIHYELTKKANEALNNGVALTIKLTIQLQEENAWFWQPNLVEQSVLFQLRFHPLTETYQVWDLETGDKTSFETLDAAKDLLGEIKDLPLIKAAKLTKGQRYNLEMQVILDIEALPLPLRPLAYFSSDWDMESDPFYWTLKP